MKNSEYLLIRNSLMSELANAERKHTNGVIVETLCGIVLSLFGLILITTELISSSNLISIGLIGIGSVISLFGLISGTSSPSKNVWWTVKFLRLDDLYNKGVDYEAAIKDLDMVPNQEKK